jgi:hypothetical protein
MRGDQNSIAELPVTGIDDEIRQAPALAVEHEVFDERRAAIIGALQITATQFAIILTVAGDVVTRFQMLKDSFYVSKAVHLTTSLGQ